MNVHVHAHRKDGQKVGRGRVLAGGASGMPVDKIKQATEKFSQHFKRIHGIHQSKEHSASMMMMACQQENFPFCLPTHIYSYPTSHISQDPWRILAKYMCECVGEWTSQRNYLLLHLAFPTIPSPGFPYQINKTNGPAATEKKDPRQKLRNYLKQQNKLISKLNAECRPEKRECPCRVGQQWPGTLANIRGPKTSCSASS